MTPTELERLEAIRNLAMCPSSPTGEWENAAVCFFRQCRKEGSFPYRLQASDSRLLMGFGKYRSMTVAQVVEKFPRYAAWVIQNVQRLDPRVRRELERLLVALYAAE